MKKHFNDGTFRGTKHMVKAIALALCFVLLFTSFDTAVFAAEDAEVFESEIELVEESDDIEEQPVEYAETEEPIDNQMILESLPLEVEEVPFEQSITVDDVVITVSADAGVFPEGASMSARKVTISEENEVAEAIDEVRDNDKKVALSYTFDITVCDMDGNEIEPDTEKGSVKVTFKMAEIANINLETEVYHLEEADGGLNAENLDVKSDEGEADEVAVETTGFSFYTVEFTYNELQYVLEGDEKVELTTILDAVGIKENGEISKIEGSDDELFKPVIEDDIWYIEAVKAFNTEEWLKVTIDGIEFEIVVTDNQAPGEWSKLLTALSGSTPSSVENQFEVSSDEDGIIIKLLADFTAGDGATTLTVSGAKKLDLNGHVINANGKSMRVLTIPSGAKLTLEDSDTTASHEGYIDADDIWHLGTGTGTSQAIAGGIITGGKVAGDNSGEISDGGGVLVKGTLKMNGGSISGNTLSYTNYSCGGGGIAVTDNGIFEMYGGHITYNKAGNGGGVWTWSGTFNMYDGAVISNCKAAASGGGVFVENAPFNMYGGVIEKCKAESGQYGNGGGIFTHTNSTFTMTGGAIKNNTAAGNGAGVHNNSGTVTLGGKARITNNMRGTDYNNLYLPSNHTVYISTTTSPTTGMSVHVTLENGTGKVTGTSGTDQYAQYFGSDKLSNGVVAKDGFVQIVSKTNIVASVNHNDQYIYYDSLQNAINAAGTEDEVQLFRDIQEDISVITDKNITLDLNGKVLKGTGAESTITVSSGATLTLCDSRVDVVHYYKYNSNGAWTWDDSAIDDAITVEEISDSTATGTPIILKGGAITGGIDTGSSASEGGGIYNSGTLIMQGGTISGNKADLGGGVYNHNGIFVMEDGTIIGNTSNQHGGGVYNYGTFTMMDGTISDNNAGSGYNGGGVYNGQYAASFVMEGGTISGNNASYGAGVYNYGSNVNFIMRGDSAVSNNVGTNGAGVYFECDGDSIFTVSGNSQINGNEATIGGGVYIRDGAFVMDAGMITGNKAGGTVNDYGGGVVLSRSGGTLTISGTAKIIGNVKGGTVTDGVLSGGTAQNVYLQTDKNITVGAGNDMQVGVTMKSPGVFTTNAAEGYLSCFSSDDSAYKVVYDSDNKLMLEKRKYYKVTIDSDITNGTVEIDSDSNYVLEGNTVTVTATPNLRYALTSLKYNDGTEDHDITTTKSFTMPEAGVTISAEFDPIGIWCADIPDQVYTGKAIKPAINVYSDGTLLKLGTDYTIAYSNNTKAALSTATNAKGKSIAPTVTISGKGNYKNTKIARTFTIDPYSLSGLEVDPATVAYTKKPIKLSPVVTLNGKKLKMGTDYIVSTTTDVSCEIKNLTEVGEYDLYIVGKGNYSGNIPYTFTITNLVPASKVSIGKIANLKYTGEEVEPDVSITYKKENVNNDFTIEYQNNTEIGTATVIITAKPGTEFSGSKSATFKIEGTSIAKAVLGADGKGKIAEYTYSGNPCKPKPDLYIGTKELENGVDYLLSYKSNVNAGTATMTVTGKGAYTGTKKFTFKINKYDAGVDAGGLIKVNNGELISVKYEKGGVTPKPRVTISINDKEQELKEKTDYTLGYSNNKEAADVNAENPKTHKPVPPTVTITFKGNLSGKQPVKFEITKKDMSQPESGCTLTASDVATKAKTFSWKQTKITITDRNGKKLAAKTDYNPNVRYFSDISCDDEYELTEATLPTDKYPYGKGWVYVKATAAETSKNYEGYVIGRYYVSGINIASVKAVIADQVYTGSEICPTEDMVTVTIKVGKETRTLSAGDPTNPDDGDYTVVLGSYTKNINKGTASLTIRGNGEYFGTKAVKFKIVNKPFEWWENLNL